MQKIAELHVRTSCRGLPCPLCLPHDGRDPRTGGLRKEFAVGEKPLPGILYIDPTKVCEWHMLPGG